MVRARMTTGRNCMKQTAWRRLNLPSWAQPIEGLQTVSCYQGDAGGIVYPSLLYPLADGADAAPDKTVPGQGPSMNGGESHRGSAGRV